MVLKMNAFNKTDFVKIWDKPDEFYMIGFNKLTNEKIIAVTISWIGLYEIYFKLTDEEYEWHKSNITALNDLAQRMAVDKGAKFYRDRLLLNEGPQK